MNIADWPLRKPLALYAAVIVGLAIGCSLWREVDLPDNLTTLIQWFGSITIVSYFASSTTEAVKGVTAYESNYTGAEREYMESDAAGGSDCTDTRGSSSVLLSSDTPAPASRTDGRRPASSPRGFIGKYPKGRKHLR